MPVPSWESLFGNDDLWLSRTSAVIACSPTPLSVCVAVCAVFRNPESAEGSIIKSIHRDGSGCQAYQVHPIVANASGILVPCWAPSLMLGAALMPLRKRVALGQKPRHARIGAYLFWPEVGSHGSLAACWSEFQAFPRRLTIA